MLLLLCLAEHAGEVVSIEDLITQVWSGVNVSPDSVYQAVASLRRQLGDDSKQPTYIATVPRRGYRMLAAVSPWAEGECPPDGTAKREPGPFPSPIALGISAMLLLALIIVVAYRFRSTKNHPSAPTVAALPQRSVAVLPFLDLTDGMKEEEFADGMTEELIDRLSKIPDFRVPAAISSFYFKDKKAPLAEIAKALGVAYVLDGSVRKSGARLRVAARLVRADNGYVIWSETYDRPSVDKLLVQEDIAGEVAKALRASIETHS